MATKQNTFTITPLQAECDHLNNSYTFSYEPVPFEAGNEADETTVLDGTAMDANIELLDLLKVWHQQNLYNVLVNEKIEVATLKIIKPHHTKYLLSKVNFKLGEIIRFENKLEIWRLSIGLPYYDYTFHSQFEANKSSNNFNTNLPDRQQHLSQPKSTDSEQHSSAIDPVRELCSVTLGDILFKKPNGQSIQSYYCEHKCLEPIHRTTLIKVIAEYFDENEIHMSLETSHRLEREICEWFDCEKPEYYRIGRRGKLYAKFCNLKSNNRKLKPKQLPPPVANTSNNLQLQPEDDAEQCIKNLKYDNLSEEDFDFLWQACCQFRLLQIRTGDQSMKAVFEKWPQYKLPSGSRLIDNDFRALHPEKGDILDHWPENFKKILKFLKEEHRIKSPEIRSVLTNINDEDYEKEEAIVRLLWCIHGFLVPTKKILRKDKGGKKSTIKYTIKDSQETFIYVGGNIQQINDHIGFLQERGENIQPLILAIGHPELKNFQQFYIYVDGVKLCFNNILRSVDICFKMFYIFNLQYPVAGENFWIFIEKYFYKINNKVNDKSTKVFFMIDKLNKTT